jgi:hypothetical protein
MSPMDRSNRFHAEELDYERKSLDRLKQQINSQPARGLPAYIQECEVRIAPTIIINLEKKKKP